LSSFLLSNIAVLKEQQQKQTRMMGIPKEKRMMVTEAVGSVRARTAGKE